MTIRKVVISAVVCAAISSSILSAQEKTSIPTKESCLKFVQEFYDWYVPKARDSHVDSLDLALKERRSAFSTRLIKGIRAVDAEAMRTEGVGLDFDWILNTQDPGDPGDPAYLVANSNVKGNVCHVDVSGQGPNRNDRIIPELNFRHGRWFFVNFHYPESSSPQWENLLSAIKAYLDSGVQSPKKPH